MTAISAYAVMLRAITIATYGSVYAQVKYGRTLTLPIYEEGGPDPHPAV